MLQRLVNLLQLCLIWFKKPLIYLLEPFTLPHQIRDELLRESIRERAVELLCLQPPPGSSPEFLEIRRV
jgi:hypothetical protein